MKATSSRLPQALGHSKPVGEVAMGDVGGMSETKATRNAPPAAGWFSDGDSSFPLALVSGLATMHSVGGKAKSLPFLPVSLTHLPCVTRGGCMHHSTCVPPPHPPVVTWEREGSQSLCGNQRVTFFYVSVLFTLF